METRTVTACRDCPCFSRGGDHFDPWCGLASSSAQPFYLEVHDDEDPAPQECPLRKGTGVQLFLALTPPKPKPARTLQKCANRYAEPPDDTGNR